MSFEVAFVLGGGGVQGAAEVGMLRALDEAAIVPDLVLGTSVGAINGAVVAMDPASAATRLVELWTGIDEHHPFSSSLLDRVTTLARSRTHLHDNAPLRRLLEATLGTVTFEQLARPFQCVAASIERARAHWFDAGPVIDAVLASAAVPGMLPAVELDGEHFLDGGLVDSIPVGRAVELGARTIYVLQVGRIETPLHAPSSPWEVGLVAFEIARRHRFHEEMAQISDDVDVHVLPTGTEGEMAFTDPSQLRYRDVSKVREREERAFTATSAYLADSA